MVNIKNLIRLISGVIYNFNFVRDKNIKNDNFIVDSDDGALKFKSERYIRNALGDINKLRVKFLADISDSNICFYLKTPLPSFSGRLFYRNISNTEEFINTFVMVNIQNFVRIVNDGCFINFRKT